MKQLVLSLLGTCEITLNSHPISNFRSARVQGLFVFLALENQQPHSRDKLATMFWADETDAIAKKNLRQSLYQLRKILGDDASEYPFLIVTRSTIQFNKESNYTLDVDEFISQIADDQLKQAIALYHGDLLDGFTCDSRLFDDWLLQQRTYLHRMALDALHTLTSRMVEQGNLSDAQVFARQQLTLEPWREEAHQQLIQILALSGERSAAIAQYETCRAILTEELGVAPSEETVSLMRRIRDQVVSDARLKNQNKPHLVTPFVGRDIEYAMLVKIYQQVSRDGLQIVILSGMAGIGKTRLTKQFLEWASLEGVDVLQGSAFEIGIRLPYQPITDVFRRRLDRENAPEDLLSDLWLSQLTRILPELRERYPDLPQPTQEENTARQHLFEAISRLGQALAHRAPVILFIDDWHWADTASMDVLQYAIQQWSAQSVPIFMLLTVRQEAMNDDLNLRQWLNRLKQSTTTHEITLSELSKPETEQFIRSVLQPDEHADSLNQFINWLFAETEGQPLFLTETLKTLVEDGLIYYVSNTDSWHFDQTKFDEKRANIVNLPKIQQIIRGWLDKITPSASQLLSAMSVLDQSASFDNLCYVSALDEPVAIDAIDELIDLQLLLETDAHPSGFNTEQIYRFTHHKINELLYKEASTPRRRLLHKRAFETLKQSNISSAELAYHASRGGLKTETIRHSLIAGNEAMALFSIPVAITHYETAFEVAEEVGWSHEISGADRQTLYTGLGRAYELINAWDDAKRIYQVMITDGQTLGAPAMECLGLNHLATVYMHGMVDFPQALATLEQARTVAEQNEDRRGLAETEWNLSLAAIHEEKPSLALQHGERAVTLARELEHPQLLARSLTSLGQASFLQRQWEKAEAYGYEALQLELAANNYVHAANSQRGLAFMRLFLGRPRESLSILKEASAFSERIENSWGLADSAWILARTYLELGDYGKAISLGRQAVEQTRGIGPDLFHLIARSAWGIIQRTIMNFDRARDLLLELMTKPSEEAVRWTDYASELCVLYAQLENWDEAYKYAVQAIRHRDDQLLPFTFNVYYETEALLHGGDEDLARYQVEQLSKIVGQNRRYQLILYRCQAVLVTWDHNTSQAISNLQDALNLAREIGLSGEEWLILGEIGKLYTHRGDLSQAQQAYREAAAIIMRIADTIDDQNLWSGFMSAKPVQDILIDLD